MRRPLIHAEKPLRRYAVRVLAASAAVAVCAAPLTPIHAADSPSVIAAARLKNHPPRNWIRHYLGEDRYKIAGGTWRFVSTELDRFYYPAYAPEMLRQSPNRVIGFASAKDAEEAGYLPGAGYAGIDPSFDRAYAGAGSSSTSSRTTVNRSAKPIRITLADGVSTILVPAGWQRLASQKQQETAVDMFAGPQKGVAVVLAMQVQTRNGYSVENLMSPRIWRTLLERMAQSTPNARDAAEMRATKVTPGRLGGMRGVTMNFPRGGGPMGIGGGRGYLVGTGNKLYFVQGNTSGADKLLQTVRFR